ncbi:MAG TPA: glycosyltransferase family 4 protein [Stellaceae bacterium]|nr:glycosyltransferase family 4 protein [Stellaceae bacterium]
MALGTPWRRPRYTLELARALIARSDIDLSLSLSRGNTALAEFTALSCPCDIVDTYSSVASFVAASLRLPMIRAALQAKIAESGADVVVATMPHVWSWFLAPAARNANVRLVTIIHDAHAHPGDLNPLLPWRIRRELAAADGVVTLSDHVKRLLVKSCDYPDERIAVLPLGPFAFTPLPSIAASGHRGGFRATGRSVFSFLVGCSRTRAWRC